MRFCRYNDNKLGIVRGEQLIDVTQVLDELLPPMRWPVPPGDQLIANLDAVRAAADAAWKMSFVQLHKSVRILSPVANPTKVIGAPANYMDHVEEARADAGINFGSDVKTIDHYGLFLKGPILVGPSEGVALHFPDRRNDHEMELAMVIGREAKNVPRENALDYVAGYCIGLDMTVRGPEDRSLRKAIDSYSVLGPWLVSADEIADPDNLDFSISVNGEVRQKSNTKYLIFDCRRLVEYASRFYTLYPGDVIMTGTPKGVGLVQPGDVMHCEIEDIGAMDVAVRAA